MNFLHMRIWNHILSLPFTAALLLAVLGMAPLASVVHAELHPHTLCAEHPGEWIEASEHGHATTHAHSGTLTLSNLPTNSENADHEACAFLALRWANVAQIENSVRPVLLAPPISDSAPALLRRAPPVPLYRLAPKNSPPHLA